MSKSDKFSTYISYAQMVIAGLALLLVINGFIQSGVGGAIFMLIVAGIIGLLLMGLLEFLKKGSSAIGGA